MWKALFTQALMIFLLVLQGSINSENIGLLIMATGKYIRFVDSLIDSAERYFCPSHNVTYFVFTDNVGYNRENTITLYQKRMGWPYDTLMRNRVYALHKNQLTELDYLFALDADMLFVDQVGNEILGERVAVLHPGFVGKRGSYETNILSKASVRKEEGRHYYAGGFFGGTQKGFFHIVETTTNNILEDLSRDLIAVWHDESHWNRYCIDYPPTVILSPSYCYPESWNLPYKKRLLALDKDHSETRK